MNSFETVIYFFENFQYKWSKDEINAVFRLYVDPWIEKISEECLQSPNSLMRLFIMFTTNPKYVLKILTRNCNVIGYLLSNFVDIFLYWRRRAEI